MCVVSVMSVCLHITCVPGVHGEARKWGSDSLELELQGVICHHVDAGNKLRTSAGTEVP